MVDEPRVPQRVSDMRRAFDAAFAEPVREAPAGLTQHVMLVRVGSTRYAVRLDECSAIMPLPAITPLPATLTAFCGVSRVRGALVPVYDLSRLLQIESAAAARRWLVVSNGDDRVGFIVDDVEGHGALAEQPGDSDDAPVVQVNGTDYRLLLIRRLVAALAEQVGSEMARES